MTLFSSLKALIFPVTPAGAGAVARPVGDAGASDFAAMLTLAEGGAARADGFAPMPSPASCPAADATGAAIVPTQSGGMSDIFPPLPLHEGSDHRAGTVLTRGVVVAAMVARSDTPDERLEQAEPSGSAAAPVSSRADMPAMPADAPALSGPVIASSRVPQSGSRPLSVRSAAPDPMPAPPGESLREARDHEGATQESGADAQPLAGDPAAVSMIANPLASAPLPAPPSPTLAPDPVAAVTITPPEPASPGPVMPAPSATPLPPAAAQGNEIPAAAGVTTGKMATAPFLPEEDADAPSADDLSPASAAPVPAMPTLPSAPTPAPAQVGAAPVVSLDADPVPAPLAPTLPTLPVQTATDAPDPASAAPVPPVVASAAPSLPGPVAATATGPTLPAASSSTAAPVQPVPASPDAAPPAPVGSAPAPVMTPSVPPVAIPIEQATPQDMPDAIDPSQPVAIAASSVPVDKAAAKSEAIALLQIVRDYTAARKAPGGGRVAPALVHRTLPLAAKRIESDAGTPAAAIAPVPPTVPAPIIDPARPVDVAAAIASATVDASTSGQWIDTLAQDIARLSSAGERGHFRIVAGQLGPVEIDIRPQGDGTAISLTVASEAAEMALRDEGEALRKEPALAALRISDVRVERVAPPHDAARADGDSQQRGGTSAQQPQTQAGMGQSASQQQQRGPGQENLSSAHKGATDPSVLRRARADDAPYAGLRSGAVGERYA